LFRRGGPDVLYRGRGGSSNRIRFRLPPPKTSLNVPEYEIDVVENEEIVESEHLYPIELKEQSSIVVVRTSVFALMNLPVQLHSQSFGGAIEVENVSLDTVLSPKFPALKLRPVQRSP
jgi:hypothetical protein